MRATHIGEFDPMLPSNKLLSLVKHLPRSHAGLIIQLCMGHIRLNKHLFK